MLRKTCKRKNCSSKRSFISSRIWLQISRSFGPSSAMKIAPPTERKSQFSVQGWENAAEILRGRTVCETLSRKFIIYQDKMCPTRFTLVRTPPEERPYNSHRMCLAWSFLTV